MEQNSYSNEVSENLKSEILTQIGMGETVADVARVYSMTEAQIYGWIMEARKRQLAQAKPVAIPTPMATVTPAPNTPQQMSAAPSMASIDMQMDALTKDFAGKLKDILKRQILESLRGI